MKNRAFPFTIYVSRFTFYVLRNYLAEPRVADDSLTDRVTTEPVPADFPFARGEFSPAAAGKPMPRRPAKSRSCHRRGAGAKLPFLQILHAIQRAENAQRFKGGDGVALAAVNVVFVEPAAIGRCEPAFALMSAENSFDARFTVNLVQAAENFQGGERGREGGRHAPRAGI